MQKWQHFSHWMNPFLVDSSHSFNFIPFWHFSVPIYFVGTFCRANNPFTGEMAKKQFMAMEKANKREWAQRVFWDEHRPIFAWWENWGKWWINERIGMKRGIKVHPN
jgi:hypothetical protein